MRTTRIKLGDVILDALVSEEVSRVSNVTDKPVEEGQNVSDHVEPKADILRLSGSMVNDAAGRLEVLRQYQKSGELLKFNGRNIYSNVVITSLDSKHNADNSKGFDYDITIQHVRIAKPETFEVNVENPDTNSQDPKTATKVKGKSNAGRVQLGEK